MLVFVPVDKERPTFPVPTPVNLVKYLEDPDYEHEDFFSSSAAVTLRARVSSDTESQCECSDTGCVVVTLRAWVSVVTLGE